MVKNNNDSSNITKGRKAWYYVPLPNEMVGVFEKIIKDHGRRYGVMDKAQMVRILLGHFIQQYEISGGDYLEALLRFRGEYKPTTKKEEEDDANDGDGKNKKKIRIPLLFPYVL